MGKITYVAILTLTAAGPLMGMLLWSQFRLHRHEWRQLLTVFFCVSVPFIVADICSHSRGWWSYNPEFILGLRAFGLPIEEIAFFFVVPFSCLALYTIVMRYKGMQRPTFLSLKHIFLLVVVIGGVLIIVQPNERTIFDVVLSAVVLGLAYVLHPRYVLSQGEVVWASLVMLLFLIVNGMLTSLPIVVYEHNFGSSIRFGSIPFEDMFYNISLLVASLTIYRYRPGKVGRAL